MNKLKRIAIVGTASAVIFGSLATGAFAKVDREPGPVEYGAWVINAPSTIDFTCGGGEYLHTLDTVNNATNGDLTGTGHYNPVPAYTWNMTGNVTGDNISMQIVYTGISLGSTYNLVGTIDVDGSISGTVDSNCQEFEMPAGTATRSESQFIGNHGQYVKTMEDKQEAAQSRVGMPVQSKGNTN